MEFKNKVGMTDSQKCGDIVVNDCGSLNYIKYIEKHFVKNKSPQKADQFVKEMKEISQGIFNKKRLS